MGGELGRHQQVVGLEGGPVRAAQQHRGADHPPPPPQRGEQGPAAGRQRALRVAEQFGQRVGGPRRLREDRPDPAQHLRERPVEQHPDGLGGAAVRRLQGGQRADRYVLGRVARPVQAAVRAAQPQPQRSRGPLVADRQRVAQIDQDRVGEGRHGRAAQSEQDLVQVKAARDPPGGRPDVPQPVGLRPGLYGHRDAHAHRVLVPGVSGRVQRRTPWRSAHKRSQRLAPLRDCRRPSGPVRRKGRQRCPFVLCTTVRPAGLLVSRLRVGSRVGVRDGRCLRHVLRLLAVGQRPVRLVLLVVRPCLTGRRGVRRAGVGGADGTRRRGRSAVRNRIRGQAESAARVRGERRGGVP